MNQTSTYDLMRIMFCPNTLKSHNYIFRPYSFIGLLSLIYNFIFRRCSFTGLLSLGLCLFHPYRVSPDNTLLDGALQKHFFCNLFIYSCSTIMHVVFLPCGIFFQYEDYGGRFGHSFPASFLLLLFSCLFACFCFCCGYQRTTVMPLL